MDENVPIDFVPTITEIYIKIRSLGSRNLYLLAIHVLLHGLKRSVRNQLIYRSYLVHQLIKND